MKDSGIGLNGEQIERIFTPYAQADQSIARRFGGTGLGLALSQRLAGLMNSHIAVDSREGEGSTFSWAVVVEMPESPLSLRDRPVLNSVRRILCVDDCIEAVRIETNLLERMGVSVTSVATVAELLSLVGAMQSSDIPDLILLDCDVASAEDSADMRAVAGAFPNIRLVLMAPMFKREIAESIAATLNNNVLVLNKPVTKPQLYALFDQFDREPLAAFVPPLNASAKQLLKGTRWLLVEDNLVNQEVAVSLLKNVGAEVVVAGSGEEALAILQLQKFHGVLMDEMLPGINGMETTRKIREQLLLKYLPIIAMSACGTALDREKAVAAGMNDSVDKPVDPPVFYATLAKWMGAQ